MGLLENTIAWSAESKQASFSTRELWPKFIQVGARDVDNDGYSSGTGFASSTTAVRDVDTNDNGEISRVEWITHALHSRLTRTAWMDLIVRNLNPPSLRSGTEHVDGRRRVAGLCRPGDSSPVLVLISVSYMRVVADAGA